jgi:presenilin-like A22 family membrane protease
MNVRIGPYLWSALIYIAALALALFIAPVNEPSLEATLGSQGMAAQSSPLWWIVVYFFGAVAVVAIVLFVIPVRYLKYLLRGLFALMYAWGLLIVFMRLPGPYSYIIAAAAGLAWLIFARVWLQDLLLFVALAAAASVFGYIFDPLTFMIFMLIIAVYDVLAVKFGFMIWMADKMSDTSSLPAFIFPKNMKDVNASLKVVQFSELKKVEPEKREHTILGGGDIGFPLMLAVAVYFSYGMGGAILVGGCALVGIMLAFVIQQYWLQGKPMPALPPITFMALIGYLITRFVLA